MTRKSIDEVIKLTNSNINGLNDNQVKDRLAKYGKNILEKDKKINPFKVFFKQLIDPLVYVLLAGFILSIILKEYTDAFIILFVILLNAILSSYQELKAEKALKALSKLTSLKCLVKRNNHIKEIDASEVVIGDVVLLDAGRNVCADIRLINSSHLLIDESSLTGESLASEKDHKFISKEDTALGDQKNMAFMSTYVIKGSGEGIVINTGMNTQIGKIAKLIKNEKKITPLQKKLNEISKFLAITTVILCVIIFLIALIQKRDTLEMLITSISLAVAVIPEGLLAVVTIVLSLGVLRLSKVNAIVKKLHSVETLGCVNVICSDKTGTLTLNQMNVTKVMVNNEIYSENDVNEDIKFLALGLTCCNDATKDEDKYIGDPTEIALLRYANNLNVKPLKRIDCFPFDSNRKMMSTLNDSYQFSKGALDSIIPLCTSIKANGQIRPINKEYINQIYNLHDTLSNDGLRVLALAYKNTNRLEETNLTFIGLAAMIDPPRKEALQSIQTLKQANIKTIMITGDHKNTALAIAKQLNLANSENEVCTGIELDKMDEKTLKENIDKYKVFARVSPENKVQIVSALKGKNNVVAMTGDGVNDAPSLKKADIGVAMGINGTDVSKNASDMILMDDNFSTIEKAVKEGRGIFNNIKKTLLFLLSSNIGEVLVMLIAIILNLPIPLIAIHILWVNLLTDTLPSLALGQDVVSDDVMKEKPRNINESIFSNKGWVTIIGYGIIIGLLSLSSYLYVPISYLLNNDMQVTLNNIVNLLNNNNDLLIKAQTFAFSTLALSQLFHSFGIKNTNKSIFNKSTFNNKLLIISLLFGILIQLAVTSISFLSITFKTSIITIQEFLIIMFFSTIPVFVHEIILIFKKDASNK